MMLGRVGLRWVTTCAVAAAAVAAGGCGSGDESEATGGSRAGADVAGARSAIAPYLDRPTPFPVDTPLKTRPSPSVKLAHPQAGTPTGALIEGIISAATKLAGVDLVTVKAGLTASETQSALDSIIAGKPDAVLLPAGDPDLFAQQLKTMVQQGIVVTSGGVMNPSRYGISGAMFDERQALLQGRILANWVVAKNGAADTVFYGVPELSFSGLMEQGFKQEMERRCPDCEVRSEPISATTIGNTAPRAVVSDLQANSDTDVAVFAAIEAAGGLPAALRTAGIDVKIVGQGADPGSLEAVRNGQIDAMLALDAAVLTWAAVDMAFRRLQDQPLTSGQQEGLTPMQLLERGTVPADISRGFLAYPDFAERFAKLWKVAR